MDWIHMAISEFWAYSHGAGRLTVLKAALLLTWINPFVYPHACCCFKSSFCVAGQAPVSGRCSMGCTPLWAQCQPGFLLPGGKTLGFLEFWREWMARSCLSRTIYRPSWRSWGGQIIPVTGRALEKLWRWKDNNETPRNHPSASIMSYTTVLPRDLLPTSNMWWMAARGLRPNLVSEGDFAQHRPETDPGEHKIKIEVHNAAIILLSCLK